MPLWQYNAWCEAYQDRIKDQLCLHVQAAYLGAYWGSASKHKRSLSTVLREIRGKKKSKAQRVSIDLEKTREAFRQYEELKKYGYYTESNNG